jgi:hypothetical protein
MRNKRLIPFRLLPGSWGLAGRAFAEAEAYYLNSGEDLERRLAEIQHVGGAALTEALLALDVKYAPLSAYEQDCRLLALHGKADDVRAKAEIDRRHGRITVYDFDLLMAEHAGLSDAEQAHAVLDVRFRHGKLTKMAYDKAKADLDERPWIGIVDQGFDMEKGVNGVYFEFDWNGLWVEYLRLNGYVGHSEEAIVERWFEDVCRATAAADAPDGEPHGVPPFAPPSRMTNRLRGNDGTFYS